MEQIEYQNRPDSLNVLPTDLHLPIIERLSARDREAFSACSKYYRRICVPFIFKNVYFDGEKREIPLEGESFKHIASSVSRRYPERTIDLVRVYSELRTNLDKLKRFPNLKILRMSLWTFPATEEAIYSAFLRLLAESAFHDTLEELELSIERLSVSAGEGERDPKRDAYRNIYSRLPVEYQVFLGETLPGDRTLESFRSMTPNLPVLKKIAFFITDLPLPTDPPDSEAFMKYGLYYHLITSAPKLSELHVDFDGGVYRESTYTSYISTSPKAATLHPDLAHVFSKIRTLSLKTIRTLRSADIERVVETFPDLRHLDIQPYSVYTHRKYYGGGVTSLKDLQTFTLPWPSLVGKELLPLKELYDLGWSWRMQELRYLESLTFVAGDCTTLLIHVGESKAFLKVSLTDGEVLKVEMATEVVDYESPYGTSEDDDDYLSNRIDLEA
ncbi:hypothetical protein TWF718_010250 [Orbilia javanica]|uniref:F-box domain-containing protein n=1 Tax=Orbilia javanica TaxID=47235 RepID=A0AAN8MP14_9PEZI